MLMVELANATSVTGSIVNQPRLTRTLRPRGCSTIWWWIRSLPWVGRYEHFEIAVIDTMDSESFRRRENRKDPDRWCIADQRPGWKSMKCTGAPIPSACSVVFLIPRLYDVETVSGNAQFLWASTPGFCERRKTAQLPPELCRPGKTPPQSPPKSSEGRWHNSSTNCAHCVSLLSTSALPAFVKRGLHASSP